MRPAPLIATACVVAAASLAARSGPYRIIRTKQAGGSGAFDYVSSDPEGRRLYVARRADITTGQAARISVFNLDTLAAVGDIANVSAHGAVVDPKSGHGYASSKPVTMFDVRTLAVMKTIDVDGSPDRLLLDPLTERVHVLSRDAPNDTIINAIDGTVVAALDLGGVPAQAQSDGKGRVYVDLEDEDAIAVLDARTLQVTATHDISAKCGLPAGLGIDPTHEILFVACRGGGRNNVAQATMAIVRATDGRMLGALPIGRGTDGAGFNPNTMEAFSSNGESGTLSIIKEASPTRFVVEQELKTMVGGNFKTMTLDAKTNRVLLIGAKYEVTAATDL